MKRHKDACKHNINVHKVKDEIVWFSNWQLAVNCNVSEKGRKKEDENSLIH